MAAGRKTGGRRVGSVNKTTKAAKEAIAECFEMMGGIPALMAWAERNEDNEKVFYAQIWPKIVPLTVGGDPDSPLHHVIRRIRVES